MKIVRIDGGLGNQMFCYAFALALQNASNEEVLIDTHRYKFFPNHNGYELGNLFEIKLNEPSKFQLWKVTYPAYSLIASRIYQRFPHRKSEIREEYTKCYPDILTEAKDGYYIGNWQWYKYFDSIKEQIQKAFTFKLPLDDRNRKLYERLLNCNSVSLHIRRGDYLGTPLYCGICDEDYYKRAIDRIRTEIETVNHYVIFSNDPEWCVKNIAPLMDSSEISIVDWNKGDKSYIDMILMSACRGNIIANSSFSWWAAYLNRRNDKIVIAPERWINLDMEYKIQCNEWLCL